MFCPKCGTQNPDDGRFCRSCGADLGNVSAALAGRPAAPLTDRKGKPVSLEGAITKIFTGLAFLIVAIILGVTGVAGAKLWWFWMLIPAFSCLGPGIAQYMQLRSGQNQAPAAPPATPAASQFQPPAQNSALPPPQTDFVAPPKASIYDTGELRERPPSVTEPTTRHLEMDSEGETMTLPKR